MSVFKKARMFVFIVASGVLIASNAFALVTILSPEEGQVFYGATATLSVKLQHTPGYDVGVGFEARQLYIPGQWPDTWNPQGRQLAHEGVATAEAVAFSGRFRAVARVSLNCSRAKDRCRVCKRIADELHWEMSGADISQRESRISD